MRSLAFTAVCAFFPRFTDVDMRSQPYDSHGHLPAHHGMLTPWAWTRRKLGKGIVRSRLMSDVQHALVLHSTALLLRFLFLNPYVHPFPGSYIHPVHDLSPPLTTSHHHLSQTQTIPFSLQPPYTEELGRAVGDMRRRMEAMDETLKEAYEQVVCLSSAHMQYSATSLPGVVLTSLFSSLLRPRDSAKAA